MKDEQNKSTNSGTKIYINEGTNTKAGSTPPAKPSSVKPKPQDK